MRIYIIYAGHVTVSREQPATLGQGEIAVTSLEDLRAARLSGKQLLALWNGLPGAEQLTKVGNREKLLDRLWAAIEALPDRELAAGTTGPRPGSKESQVIGLLRRPEGVTVAEIMTVTGWQPHTVRGMFSGALKKKRALTIVSAKEERGRVYRIVAPVSA